MKKIGSKGRSWLKGFHIFFSCLWLGAAFSMMLMTFTLKPVNGDEIFGVNSSIKLIDDFIVIPAAIGSLITGLLFSWMTNWGFFRFHWVTVKWIITVASIIFGTFWLGPWLNEATAISDLQRVQALQNQLYLYDKQMNGVFGTVQTAALIFLVFISVFKPWGNRKSPRD